MVSISPITLVNATLTVYLTPTACFPFFFLLARSGTIAHKFNGTMAGSTVAFIQKPPFWGLNWQQWWSRCTSKYALASWSVISAKIMILQPNQQCYSSFTGGEINKVCQSNDTFQPSSKTLADEKNILLQSVLWFHLTSGTSAFLIMDIKTEKILALWPTNIVLRHYYINNFVH